MQHPNSQSLSFPILSYLGSCRTRATNGNCCVFPFIYKRKRYYGCTKRNAARKWCATTPNYDRDRLWSYCRGVSSMYRKIILLILSLKWTLGSPSPLRLFPSSWSLQIPPVPSLPSRQYDGLYGSLMVSMEVVRERVNTIFGFVR